MRGVLLLVVGTAAGLGAGWVLFGAADTGRSRDRATGRDQAAAEGRYEAARAGDAGPMPGAVGASAEATRAVVPSGLEERIVRRLMREVYDERVKTGKPPEEDIFEAGVREVLRRSARNRDADARSVGASLEHRERTRADAGEIGGSPLVLQLCVAAGGQVRLTERGNSDRFEVNGPPAPRSNLKHVTGGTVPPGSMFLIERVVIRAHAVRGRLYLSLPEMDRFDWDPGETGKGALELELKGLVHLPHGSESGVSMWCTSVAASVEMHGRLVPDAEGETLPTRPLIMGEGWLTGEPVLMQVRADHGGGNDRIVYLNGKLYRIDMLETQSIWEDAPDLRRNGSLAYYRGCGRVPPGKAFRVTRVEYRARLAAGENSGMSIRVGGQQEVKSDASQGASVQGAWTGDIVVLPGEEDRVSVTCNKYGLAEIIVFGELVDDPRAKK